MNNIQKKFLILTFAIFLTILYIFMNSSFDVPTSKASSDKVAEVVENVVDPIKEDADVQSSFIRKLAHFIEFCILGLELAFYFKRPGIFPVFFVMMIGLTDETIQILSDRGPQVQDVWLDFSGGCFGIAICWMIVGLMKRKQLKKGGKCHE